VWFLPVGVVFLFRLSVLYDGRIGLFGGLGRGVGRRRRLSTRRRRGRRPLRSETARRRIWTSRTPAATQWTGSTEAAGAAALSNTPDETMDDSNSNNLGNSNNGTAGAGGAGNLSPAEDLEARLWLTKSQGGGVNAHESTLWGILLRGLEGNQNSEHIVPYKNAVRRIARRV